ncbi:ABC transporter ATP-binding protein [Streptomyces sp. NPDC086554]|uniref:ABC transporter ATP-binding protein n=1 Tax=Streptomyces sp. NPDC086554 TaxID=3154864 RepID=UPI00343C5954
MRPVIDFRQVALTYPGTPAVEALKPCDLQIAPGEYVTVVGPSGSGKSSFLNVAGLLHNPTSGDYLLEGTNVASLKEHERARLRGEQIGFVFQAFHLLPHRTVTENVELSMLYQRVPRHERTRRAREELIKVGLGHRLQATPTTLSGGEQQRAAIARALAGRPALLLCDEPTGNLDSVTAHQILDTLSELHTAGMTMVVITHSDEVAQRGQRTISIRDGVLTERAMQG